MPNDLDENYERTYIHLGNSASVTVHWLDKATAINRQSKFIDTYVVETISGGPINKVKSQLYINYISEFEDVILETVFREFVCNIRPHWKLQDGLLPDVNSIQEFIVVYKPKWHLFDYENDGRWDNEMAISLVKCIDGEHDLNLALGVKSLVKAVWIE